MRAIFVYGLTALLASSASAQSADSFVTGDGLNRAPAVVLHCVGPNNAAGPCGTSSQPLVVSPSSAMANAANQTAELQAAQAAATALGSQQDSGATSGQASVIALLKGAIATLGSGVTTAPTGGTLISRSLSVPAQASVSLFPVNAARHYFAFQAPNAGAIWVNLVGGPAAPNGIDCAQFAPGTFYESGPFVNRGAITVYSPVATTISAWEG